MVRRLLYVAFGLAAMAVTLYLMAISYGQMTSGGLALAHELGLHGALQLPALYFLLFIGVLMLRYIGLIVMSFLESMRKHLARPGEAHEAGPWPLVSIVVPAYNEELLIQPAIRSLLALDYPKFEVIVVDDGSTDDTYLAAQEIARQSATVPVRVLTQRNSGKAEALNTGLARTRGELVLNMDADTKLSTNSLRDCVRHFTDSRVGAVAGNVKIANRENLLTNIQALEYVEGLAMVRRAQSLVHAVSIIPGPLGMFRRQALIQAGGYDTDTYAEDCDLTLKLLVRGWHVVYESEAHAQVETPSRLLDLIKQRYRWTRGILQAIRKHKRALWQPHKSGTNGFILWYMLFESVIWPVSSVLGTLYFASIGLLTGSMSLAIFWWIQLTLLDMLAAAYCVAVEKESPRLVPYAVLFRTFYIVIVDVAKLFAIIEEMLGIEMGWGKLQREGKL